METILKGNTIEKIGELLDGIRATPETPETPGTPENTKKTEGFVNNFELNQTCMVLIVVFVLLFMYKKEVMAMVNKYLK